MARKVRLRGSAGILDGRIYDDRSNRMSPTNSNKLGVRYCYYVSHAFLQSARKRPVALHACRPQKSSGWCWTAATLQKVNTLLAMDNAGLVPNTGIANEATWADKFRESDEAAYSGR